MEGGALKLLLIVAVKVKTDEKDPANVNCCEEVMDEERGGMEEGRHWKKHANVRNNT